MSDWPKEIITIKPGMAYQAQVENAGSLKRRAISLSIARCSNQHVLYGFPTPLINKNMSKSRTDQGAQMVVYCLTRFPVKTKKRKVLVNKTCIEEMGSIIHNRKYKLYQII